MSNIFLRKGEHFEYRIKPTKGKIWRWRVDIWVYKGQYKPLWNCSTRYFKTREKAVEWRIKKKGTESS